jgi:hypothetical protein
LKFESDSGTAGGENLTFELILAQQVMKILYLKVILAQQVMKI